MVIIKKKKHKLFYKRAGMEPNIGNLKSDYRLSHNFYKDIKRDPVNIMLTAAAYNFKRAMRVLLCFIKTITEKFNWDNFSVKWAFYKGLLYILVNFCTNSIKICIDIYRGNRTNGL